MGPDAHTARRGAALPALIVLAWVGCGPRENSCRRPLSDSCTDACPTLDDIRACAADTGSRYFESTCLNYVVVFCGFELGGTTYWFDSTSGSLVAKRADTDYMSECEGTDTSSTSVWFGDVPPEECW